MNIKKLLSIAVIAALPFGANAENISGAMYAAPTRADTNHPAPTTNAYAPYGRIDIDTADQDHIATTAYVKGAYNSAIAAVNNVANTVDGKQNQLVDWVTGDNISINVVPTVVADDIARQIGGLGFDVSALSDELDNFEIDLDNSLITAKAALVAAKQMASVTADDIDEAKQNKLYTGPGQTVNTSIKQTISANPQNALSNFLVSEKAVSDFVNAKRVEVYTNWDDDTDKTEVAFVTAQ